MSLETIWCDLKTCELNYDDGYDNGHCLNPTNADKCPYYKLLSSESQTDQDEEDDWEKERADRCYECRGYGDDYYYDPETGEDVNACDDCPWNKDWEDE